MQEVMLRVWRHAHRYDPDRAAATTWIYSIARNARTDRFRRMGRPEPDPDDPMWVPAAADDPLEAASATQTAERVRRALATLPPKQRDVMERAYLQGQTMAEIADDLGVPLGTVKSRSRLALTRLRERLQSPG
jgi:RNA polymerase sigma-70 factor (ECF subfamily)